MKKRFHQKRVRPCFLQPYFLLGKKKSKKKKKGRKGKETQTEAFFVIKHLK